MCFACACSGLCGGFGEVCGSEMGKSVAQGPFHGHDLHGDVADIAQKAVKNGAAEEDIPA